MFEKKCLGLTEARAAVEAVLEEASKLPDAPIAVAVVDDYGRLVYFARMDGCPPVVVELAINKAYTAAVALLDTVAFAERDKGWGRELATYGDARFTYLQGGLVIRAGGEAGHHQPSSAGSASAAGCRTRTNVWPGSGWRR